MATQRTRTPRKTAARGPRNLPHLAGRLFGVPLLLDERKLDAIVPAFLRRLNGERIDDDDDLQSSDYRDTDEPVIDQATGIAVIPIIGSLIRRPSMMDAWSGLTSYDDIASSLDCALGDARVRGILLQIDSFGGEAGGCFELCDKIFNSRRLKPIWAVADIEALSAGYAILSSATRCYVAARGHAGSIGVVTVHVERAKQNEMMGVTYTVLRAGERKGDFNPYEALSAEAAAKQLEYIERTRQTFAQMVARNRGSLTVRSVLDTEGQFYDAQDSLAQGLVDGIESYENVFTLLTAAIPAATSTKPAPPPEPLAPTVDPTDEDAEPDPTTPNVTSQSEGTMPEPTSNTPVTTAAAPVTTAVAAPTVPAAPAPPPALSAVPATTTAVGNVVALETARPESAAREIAELCTIAGKPELCAAFIAEGLSVGDSRKRLIDMRAAAASAGAGDELNNHPPTKTAGQLTMPTTGAASPEALASWDKAFDRVHAGDPRFVK